MISSLCFRKASSESPLKRLTGKEIKPEEFKVSPCTDACSEKMAKNRTWSCSTHRCSSPIGNNEWEFCRCLIGRWGGFQWGFHRIRFALNRRCLNMPVTPQFVFLWARWCRVWRWVPGILIITPRLLNGKEKEWTPRTFKPFTRFNLADIVFHGSVWSE